MYIHIYTYYILYTTKTNKHVCMLNIRKRAKEMLKLWSEDKSPTSLSITFSLTV